jgi:PKD repeat protein
LTRGDAACGHTAATTRTYAAAGTYTVTLVSFDNHGDQARIINTVVVS